MKRNSKRFLALFLSVAMTITPAVLTQADGDETNIQITATPASADKATETAEITKAPETTEAPEISKAPETTEDPEISKAPETTGTPEIPKASETTGTPEISKAPETTEAPEISKTPEATETPETTKKPETTNVPADDKKNTSETNDTKDDSDASDLFQIISFLTKHEEDKTIVTLITSTDKYDAIYLGSVEDAAEDPENVCTGISSGEGYTFEFAVPSTVEAQKYQMAIRNKEDGVWHPYFHEGEFTITIPGNPNLAPTETPKPTEAPEPTVTPVPAETPDNSTCDNGIYNIAVTSSSTMFRVVDCKLTSKNGKMTAILTLSGTGYDYLYVGTKEEAAEADASMWVPYVVNAEGKYTYEIPVKALDREISVAAFSHRKQIWYDRTLTFTSESLNKIGEVQTENNSQSPEETPGLTPTPSPSVTPENTPTPTPIPKPDKKPEKESKYESDLSGGTAAVNSSTALADGTYTPDSFSWSGGTGKVSISCSKVTVTGGQAYATIVFSSEYYGYVKANGNKYYGACGGGTSTFTIPVALNQNNTIIGMTTRMSQAHEITYTIYIALKGADTPKKTDKDNPASDNSMLSTGNKKLDESAPEITGLEYKDETKLEHAKYFKLYHYAKGITLLEVDMTTDTARKAETAAENKSAQDSQEASSTENLYTGNVVKYLIVPDGAVIPAGLDKDVILIQQPVETVYMASKDALNILDKLKLTEKIKYFEADSADSTDYKTLVKNQCELAILSSDILPAKETETDDKMKLLKDAAEKYSTLKIPFIVDRSSDEKDEAAKAEWEKAYEAIFVTNDEA